MHILYIEQWQTLQTVTWYGYGLSLFLLCKTSRKKPRSSYLKLTHTCTKRFLDQLSYNLSWHKANEHGLEQDSHCNTDSNTHTNANPGPNVVTTTIPYISGTPETIPCALQLYYTRCTQTDNHVNYLIWNDSWVQTFYKTVKDCELRIYFSVTGFCSLIKRQSEFFLP